ncbi:glycerol-3-phosphate dehydrogenase subunit GlpB [Schaalia sp. lx-100]|uniref:glycerol-3-phosphate dehydrogenase subunit GlpB n=1 Tax=Schaalia sp. lx-100 TaxID=2899081 RepID=UPI001E5E78B2|nr:glycerol-3-phosphate dehydrogenase subunit GlpB [Schaalia sp. lx-100]MCD4557101.1 glycerol-3-phosphate dehydrogenase subunit GlpB [Schaalia sp. lx-100]
MRDVVVIGAGLAGLAATLRLSEAGAKVTLVTKGIGGLQLGQGTVDILGYTPERTEKPLAGLDEYIRKHPKHPYRHFTAQEICKSAQWYADILGSDMLMGTPERNVFLPTAVGALRPTALYPPSMHAGTMLDRPIAVVGLRRLKDFPATLIADNLCAQKDHNGHPITARALWIDVEIRHGEVDTNGVNHARFLDTEEGRRSFVDALQPLLREGEIVALPAILGLNNPHVWQCMQEMLGHDICEIPVQPPSVPGMRMNQKLTELVKKKSRLMTGTAVISSASHGDSLTSVTVNTAGRQRVIEARSFLIAAGGFESGALELDSYMQLKDTILDLPVWAPDEPLLHGDFWGPDQPLFLCGFDVDHSMRVLNEQGKPAYANVYAAGGNLCGATRWREKSGEGIALASALRAADSILGSLS